MHASELVLTAPVIGQWSPLPLSMTKRLHTSDRTSMPVVEGWLNALGGMPPQQCPTCGSTMTDISAAFFLRVGDESWTAMIPIYSSCEPEVGRTSRLPRPGFGTGWPTPYNEVVQPRFIKNRIAKMTTTTTTASSTTVVSVIGAPLLLPRFYTCMRCHAPSSEFLRKICDNWLRCAEDANCHGESSWSKK